MFRSIKRIIAKYSTIWPCFQFLTPSKPFYEMENDKPSSNSVRMPMQNGFQWTYCFNIDFIGKRKHNWSLLIWILDHDIGSLPHAGYFRVINYSTSKMQYHLLLPLSHKREYWEIRSIQGFLLGSVLQSCFVINLILCQLLYTEKFEIFGNEIYVHSMYKWTCEEVGNSHLRVSRSRKGR